MNRLNEKGWEIPDQTPVAIPAYIKHRDQRDSIREMIRAELSREMAEIGLETFAEADDFDVGDDFDPTSPYEEQFDPESGQSLWDTPMEYMDSSNQNNPRATDQETVAETVAKQENSSDT